MPRLIDHEARALELTEAAWRVLERDGVAAVSVRNVAAEAGVATASLRRAFPRQVDLLVACLDLMGERVAARVGGLDRETPLAWGLAAIAEALPLDAERRLEMEVYLALGTASFTDADLAAAFARVRTDLVRLCHAVIGRVAPGRTGVRLQADALHLAALTDGLALALLHGEDPDRAMDVMRGHLRTLGDTPG